MQHRILTLLARTPVHVGAGNSVGAVDAPVMRERHTHIPIIPGTSLKGVLADLWLDELVPDEKDPTKLLRPRTSDVGWLFGHGTDKDASAGALLVGEARVLAFPVRSAKGAFAWITCPLALTRLQRDADLDIPFPNDLDDESCYAGEDITMDGKVVLEEYCLDCRGAADAWKPLMQLSADAVWQELPKRFALVSDGLFSYFAEHACEVVTRVRIDDVTGTVAQGALFNQEQVPSETMFYAVVAAQREKTKSQEPRSAQDALAALATRLNAAGNLIQVGGDETVGLGYCSTNLWTGGDA